MPGSFEFFQVPGAVSLVPYSVNAALNVTGSYSFADGIQHGFVRTGCGKLIRFDVGLVSTQPIRINAGGEIAGTYSDVSGFDRGFVRFADGATTKIDLGGSSGSTEVTDINASGTVIGIYATSNSFPPSQAYFRTRNGIVLPFTVPGSTWVYPESINDAGQITGFYLFGNGVGGFVRTPDGAITVFNVGQGIVPLAINQGGNDQWLVHILGRGHSAVCTAKRGNDHNRSPAGNARNPVSGYQSSRFSRRLLHGAEPQHSTANRNARLHAHSARRGRFLRRPRSFTHHADRAE